MSEIDIQFKHITKGIGEIKSKVAELSGEVSELAVHKERLENLVRRVDCLWKKFDDKIFPQLAECPKSQIRWLWFFMVPLGFSQLALGLRLLLFRN